METLRPNSALLTDAEQLLNRALADYEAPPSSALAREFYELRTQATIFNYDVAYDVVSFWRNEPSGFSEKVALKNLVHKLYEYDKVLSKHWIARVLELARARNVPIQSADIKAQRRKWREELTTLQSWSDLRNQATGHYGKDTAAQVALLKQLRRDQVMKVAAAFLSFNMIVLKMLADVGRRQGGV
jgi:hypothetical protein